MFADQFEEFAQLHSSQSDNSTFQPTRDFGLGLLDQDADRGKLARGGETCDGGKGKHGTKAVAGGTLPPTVGRQATGPVKSKSSTEAPPVPVHWPQSAAW